MEIRLKDGAIVELEAGATGLELARKLKKSISGPALALELNGELRDLVTPLESGALVSVLTFDDEAGRELFWHSSAHLLAQAVSRLFPGAKATIGPALESGFYYDFADLSLTGDDIPAIEAEVQKIARENIAPERIEYCDKAEAIQCFASNPFKVEMIESLDEELSAYRQGDFIDLCRGPHIPNLRLIQAFKITKISGAYWRGDREKPQLTRIYGVSFPDKNSLKQYLAKIEEAEKRDHRVLGSRLGLFSFHKEGPGMPLFHPKGMVIWGELLKYWEECHKREGYHQIKTPVLMAKELWETSGHWDYYRENMYTSEIDDKTFVIKPMNCPGAMLFFKENKFSYRQLPLKVAEVGLVHRHELSGALSGLFRVRSFHQDDAHIFMRPEDIEGEIDAILSLAICMYETFGLECDFELSTRPEKSIGSDEQWEAATNGLISALERCQRKYRINEGDGAFYGPKIDIHIRDAIGRSWQCGTIQLDMSLPERFDLSYSDVDDKRQRPVMAHRVVYGSIERFFGVLVEHFNGKFPMWLSPVHAAILPVSEAHHDYACAILGEFRSAGLRAEVNLQNQSISKKVRNAHFQNVNYTIVVGDRELESNTLAVRAGNKVLGTELTSKVIASLVNEYQSRSLRRDKI